jgi:hypothetical protein
MIKNSEIALVINTPWRTRSTLDSADPHFSSAGPHDDLATIAGAGRRRLKA